MSNFLEYFASRVEEILSQYNGRVIVFFKGFSFLQIKQLIYHPKALLNDPSLIQNNQINIDALNDKWLELITTVTGMHTPLVGFYEELLVMREFLPRMNVDQLVVVENNILSPYSPCCFSYDDALMLFDYLQSDQSPKGEKLDKLSQYYGDVKLLSNRTALLLPATVDDNRVTNILFWADESVVAEYDLSAEHIEVGSLRDWEYCVNFSSGVFSSALILQNGNEPGLRQKALLCAAKQFNISVFVDDINLHREKIRFDADPFVPLLKRHWGETAEFRPLLFYRDPDQSKDTETISQGEIIAEIIEQCESAKANKSFSNIFITAPTGSGKSILFQIPALYLAEKYNYVTIVVSPLIALMNDQVDQLKRERGITIAACINSSMSIEERVDTIEKIQSGKISLLYLAPELLLTTHLQSFLGGRLIGLIVIDEAHTVTSWGRDFRSDYWFLGDFLKRNARDGLKVPVLCLTATAVYSGEDDVVNDTIQELGLERTIIHLGNVRRENISFDIRLHSADISGIGVETKKYDLVLKQVRQYIASDEKVLTYFPFRSQVDQLYDQLSSNDHVQIRRYHGQVSTPERRLVERDYKNGVAKGLFCTKAFGMGVDVPDIKHIIHFAPSGTLADYVQEIGRAARNTNIHGIAHIDFYPSDLRYARTLNRISEMRQYQLREVLKKVCSIYRSKNRRNLLISPETFEYLFSEKEAENRTKSALMLLAKDLDNKYTFPVLIVRPKPMLSKNYIIVPHEIEDSFLAQYGQYARFEDGISKRIISSNRPGVSSDITVSSIGNTFLVDMAAIWENCYPDLSFGMFKKEFFEKGILIRGERYRIAPRVRVEIRYTDDYSVIVQRVEQVVDAIVDVFRNYKTSESKQFTAHQFEVDLEETLGEKIVPHEKIGLLLDVFTKTVDEDAPFTPNRIQVRVLSKRKMSGSEESVFLVSSTSYAHLKSLFMRYISPCKPTTKDNSYVRFYPLITNKQIEIMPLLRILELLGLANYEIRGGEKAEIFIRINDPAKLDRIAKDGKYTNKVLHSIQQHHRKNEKLMIAFFTTEMNESDRWELIEQYFLGNMDFVQNVLKIHD